MGSKGQRLLREDWAGLGGCVGAGQPAHCTLYLPLAPGVPGVPRKGRGSPFLIRVSRSCVASHGLALRARVEPGKKAASPILTYNNAP